MQELSSVSVAALAAMLDVADIEFEEYRGCLIRRAVFDTNSVDTWLAQTNGDVSAVETVVNHVHLYDLVDVYDDSQLGELEALARRLAEVWRGLLAVRYPDRELEVSFASEPDEYGPTLSIRQVQ